jgi:anaerobic selenocysteine-containing dehydrogenase
VVYLGENGRPVKLEGDKEQPMSKGFYCARGRALIFEQPFHKDRLRHPLKRVGKKGEGKWQRVTWDQALDEIAAKLKEIKEKYGAEAICLAGDTGVGQGSAARHFMKLLGSPNYFILGGQVCYGNSTLIDQVTYGTSAVCDRSNSMCTVLWGTNPAIAKPEFFRYIMESKRKGGKVITVDPLYTECARISDIWLQIRPGSDNAMMLAWLNVIINEELYDREFVEKWTNAPYLVRLDLNKILRESDVAAGGDPEKFMAWNPSKKRPVAFDRTLMRYNGSGTSWRAKGRAARS